MFFSRPTPIGGPWASHWLTKGWGGTRRREGPLAPTPNGRPPTPNDRPPTPNGRPPTPNGRPPTPLLFAPHRSQTRSPGREYTHGLRTCFIFVAVLRRCQCVPVQVERRLGRLARSTTSTVDTAPASPTLGYLDSRGQMWCLVSSQNLNLAKPYLPSTAFPEAFLLLSTHIL